MAYTRGNSSQIVVGAAAIFVNDTANTALAAPVDGESYKTTLSSTAGWTNVGYTNNGLELTFQPDFGEVKVDQMLDVAKLYKQGMKVELKTSFAEATLENLLIAIAGKSANLTTPSSGDWTGADQLELVAGDLGEYPIERSLVAVGASTQPDAGLSERIYKANRVLSIQNVTVSAKRDTPTEFEVTFRLLPDNSGVYGKIVDRTYTIA